MTSAIKASLPRAELSPMNPPVVSTEGPLDFARGRLRPERRDLLSPISRLSWREGLSAPRFALRSRRRRIAMCDSSAAPASGRRRLWLMTPSPSYDEGSSPCRTPARGRKRSANCGKCLWGSVPHREALAGVLGLLDLVDDGDREILAADAALALGILDQLVETAAELAGALPGRDRGRRRDGRPVEVLDLLDLLVSLQRRQSGRRLHALLRHVVVMALAVLAQQAAGADHEQRALHARLADGVDHAPDVVLVPLHRDHDDVVALQDLDQRRRVRRAAGADHHAGPRRDLARIARDGRDGVLARKRFLEDAAADIPGGADQGDVAHLLVPFMRSPNAATVAAGASCGTLWPIPGSTRRS